MRVVRTAFRRFLAMEISWRAGSATPLCRARDVDKTGEDFEVGHSSADFCLELRHRAAFAGQKACLISLFSSEYICANIPSSDISPITCICRSLPSIIAALAQLATRRCDHSWHYSKYLMPHVGHVAMRAVYARSHPFWFFHPSLPHLSSFVGRT